MKTPPARSIVIRADESAHWVVAGMRQLERIFRALQESLGEPASIWVEWDAHIPAEQRWLPNAQSLPGLELQTTEAPTTPDLLLSTHLFLYRNPAGLVSHAKTKTGESWEYLDDPSEIPGCEKRFLRGSGKSQDGLVSRFLNRPISRSISRVLLKFPVTPSAWTIALLVFPLAAAIFLLRGGYANVVSALVLFQFYSILDGCDGEIARAKYLESTSGKQLDTWCDVGGMILLAVTLGYGLSRAYFCEGLIVAALIATNEMILALPTQTDVSATPGPGSGAVYPRHRSMVENSGLLLLGPRLAGWLIQLTKRDVAMLFFLLLALVGQPAWILHLLGAVAAISSFLALRARFRSPLAR